jgi:6-phosphogluconolactonase
MLGNRTHILICKDENEAAVEGAAFFLRAAGEAVAARGAFQVAVSGGSTPRKMHTFLSRPPYQSKAPWLKTHLYWVDERCVPHEDPASNYGTAYRDFIVHIPLPEHQIHPMPVNLHPDQGALEYESLLNRYLPQSDEGHPIFDLIMLGIGADGHTASLFPGDNPSLHSRKRVIAIKDGNPEVYRLTLNFNVLNSARKVAFLVTGDQKSEVLRTLFENPSADLPAQRVAPVRGETHWILDRAAAAMLTEVQGSSFKVQGLKAQ